MSGLERRGKRPARGYLLGLFIACLPLAGVEGVASPPPAAGPERASRWTSRPLGLPAPNSAAQPRGKAGLRPPPPRGEAAPSEKSASRSAPARRPAPSGKLAVVPGGSRPGGEGSVRRFVVEVEKGLKIDPAGFARRVQRVLSDRRGWGAGGRIAFKRVDSPPASFRVALATPATTNRLCAPMVTAGRFSCHQRGRAVLNSMRWIKGAAAYGDDLDGYRTYLINHEVGHALGHSWHRACPEPGALAPVMMQQTLGVGPCRPHPWPLPEERASLP
jgi:hypothetical protein